MTFESHIENDISFPASSPSANILILIISISIIVMIDPDGTSTSLLSSYPSMMRSTDPWSTNFVHGNFNDFHFKLDT